MPPQPDAGSGGAAEPAGHRAVAHDDDASSNASSDYHEPHGLKEHLEHRRRQVMSWIRKNRVLFDFLAYSSFLIAFTVVAMEANPGQDLIEQNRAIKAAVAEQEFWANASHIRKDFYDIDAVSDFWNYLTPFVNVVLSESFPDKPGFFSGYFRILGLMRLRQVRVKKGSCKIPKELNGYIQDCYASFSEEVMDSVPYGPLDPKTQVPVFKWFSEREMMEGSYVGRSGIQYPGSGYNVTLPLKQSHALKEIYFLKDNNWIDLQTRAVFIDFIVYNANVRLITLIKVAVEFPASSGCRPFLLLRTSQIDRLVQKEMTNTSMLAEFVLLVLTSSYVLNEVYNVRRRRWGYFDDKWVYLEIINYLLFFGAFIMRFQPFYFVYKHGFPPRPDEFINYETPMWAIIQWKNIMSINSVITWLRLFKYLRTVPFMQLLIGTVQLAMGQITSFLTIFVIILAGFTLANLLAFGGEMPAYRTYEFTFYSLYRSLLGADYFDEMYQVNRFLGPLLYVSWTLIGFFLLLNMFVAILNDAIDEVKKNIPRVSFGTFIWSFVAKVQKKIQAKYDKIVEDPDQAHKGEGETLDRLPAFHHAKAEEEKKVDPLEVLKRKQAAKLSIPIYQDDGTRPDTSASAGAQQLEDMRDCETDAERIALLERRMGKVITKLHKLRGPEPDRRFERMSSFANPYGLNRLSSL